ncbi:hypothetical protein [Thioalkalivibrio thiocyanodenitrificans]|uniref:hypothetical protein n=1 Tax=Thioalkalivibrio thiocyanodenitrificans TaxID=243063 RepID=UPI0003A74525|nr:hypothetical protein [Thioalkalivibrio thiocyanodenitrificans]
MPSRRNPSPAGSVLDEAELRDPPDGEVLRLRFKGPFEGRQVTWNATLRALGASRGTDQADASANFIDVGDDTPDGITLTVGLAVERIDLATVRNAIIMIRRYKRLRRGRHAW